MERTATNQRPSWSPPDESQRLSSVDDMIADIRSRLPAGGAVVNAVFKGGGAKGVAYAGALQVCQDAGIRFKAVAGASAGAITATLVACGYDAYELEGHLTAALQNIDNPKRAMLAFGRSSLLSRDRLEDWLEERIRDKVPVPADRRPTFSDIVDYRGIDLYVVAMDLASRQPVVFSNRLSGDTDVISAVVASSAIPIAFEPVRMLRGEDVHRLIDGGTYANYPEFVFRDAEFRRFHRLGIEQAPTIGFSLEDKSLHDTDRLLTGTPMTPVRRARLSTDRGSLASETGRIGVLASSPIVRWATVIAPVVVIVAMASMVVIETRSGPAALGWLPATVFDPAILTLIVIMTIGSVGALVTSFVMARLGRDLLDVGVMGVLAATGVGPSVPYWFGAIPDATSRPHTVVRIPVPAGLTTLAFSARQQLVDAAVAAGRHAAATTLLRRVSGEVAPIARAAATQQPAAGERPSETRWREIRSSALHGIAAIIAGLFTLAFLVNCFDAFTARSFGLAAWYAIGFFALVVITLWVVSRRKTRLRDSPYPILGYLPGALLGVLSIGFAIVAVALVLIAGSQSSTVEFLAAQRYGGTIENVEPGDTATDRPDYVDVRFDSRDLSDDVTLPAFYSSTLDGCAGYDNQLRSDANCYRFIAPSSEFAIGQWVVVAVDTDAGVSHVVADGWLLDEASNRVFGLAFAAVAIVGVYHSIRCIRWRRDLEHRSRLAEHTGSTV